MKKLIILTLVSFFFVACGNQKSIETDSAIQNRIETNQNLETPTVTTQAAKSVVTGGICGGPDKRTCDRGNICVFDDQDPTGKGICDLLVVDERKECPETQVPVCGSRKNQKHGFLNECYLAKHGAEFVQDGLCKKTDISGQCGAKAIGIGTCFKTVEAYEFDGESCQKKYITGCEAEIPFETMEACENTCQ